MEGDRTRTGKRLTLHRYTSCNTGFFGFLLKAFNHEAYIPTFQDPPRTHSRLSCPHENQGRPRDHQRAPGQRASAPRRLTGRPASTRPGVLRQPGEFEAVMQSGLRVSSRNFVARALANDAKPRLGMIAGKKAAARAVDRNRAKRLIREIFRGAAPGIGAYDVTIQLRSDLRSQHNSAVRAELQGLIDSLVRRCAAPPASQSRSATPAATRISPDRQ